jgi:uncharacterized membrane protein YozB (DUF420 family)
MDVHSLPPVNAALNATATVLLLWGRQMIRKRRIEAHRKIMISAFVVSSVFLICYLTYHFSVRVVTTFAHPGPIRYVYYAILITHVLLAFTVPPLALVTLYRAWRGWYDKHARIARWTYPIWLYVSVTGVIVYLMLYQM